MPTTRALGFAALLRRMRWLAAVLALAALGPQAAALDGGGGVSTSYGYAVFGSLKYGPGFQHFDYANPDAPKGGTYRYGQPGTFDSLNQIALLGTFPPPLLYMADSLMRQSRDEPASYYCLVCKRLSWPADKAWVEFELDPAAHFDDGHPVTADDLIFSANLGKGLSLPAFSRVAQVVSKMEKLGPHRVRFHFTMKHNPTLITVVALMPIMPEHYWRGRDPFKPSLAVPVGLGPYRIERAEPGRTLILRRDPKYWARNHPINRGRFNFDVVRNDYYRDNTMLNEAFRVGLSDLRLDTSASDIRQEASLPVVQDGNIRRIQLKYENGAIYNSINFNARRPFLADRRVRQALLLAYDYEWVRKVILGGNYGRLASNFPNSDFVAAGLPSAGELAILNRHRDSLPPEVFASAPTTPVGGSRAQMRANLRQAKALLAQAGYRVRGGRLVDPATGQPVRLKMLAYSPLVMNNVSLFISNAKRLGVQVEFRAVDAAQMKHLVRNYDYDILYNRQVFAPLPTPGVGLAMVWTSGSAKTPNLLNYSGVSDPAIDDAIATMIAATDRKTVVDAMRVVDRVARFQYYTIPMQHSYPTPVGQLSVALWDKFGRPAEEQTWNFPYYSADNWWYDPARAARLRHGIYR